jgi:predicted amidophosphoribosyltransferase
MRLDTSKIDLDALMAMCEESMFGMSDNGFCVACGAEQGFIEPDAEERQCDACGEHTAYGAERLLLEMVA